MEMMKKKRPTHTHTVLIALERPKTFKELEKETKIPPSSLSRSLKVLKKGEAIVTRPLNKEEEEYIKGLWKYQLTEKGKDLFKVAKRLDETLEEFWTNVEV